MGMKNALFFHCMTIGIGIPVKKFFNCFVQETILYILAEKIILRGMDVFSEGFRRILWSNSTKN